MIFAMIVVIILILFFVVILFKSGSSTKSSKKVQSKENMNNNENQEEVKGIKRANIGQGIQRKDIFDFMEFDKVEDDMIIQNNGNRYTMVIQCKWINYDLISYIKQFAVEESFIVFLNTLKYPIQIYVQARSVDLKKSMEIYRQRVNLFRKQFNEYDEAFRKKINTLDATEEEIDIARNERAKFANIYEYAEDINKYVERLSMNKNILQRKFYIVISYSKSEITASGNFSNDEIKEICRRELYTRANSLISSLMTCSVIGRTLTSEQLIELLFVSYNRDDERLFDITTALDSDFYRLYSTSKDIYDKKREKIQEEVSKEAIRRVQEAIRATARREEIKSDDEVEDEFEESVDREAVNIIREAEIDNETKETLTNVIAQNHVINSRARAEKRRKKQEQKNEEQENKELENNIYEEEKDENEKVSKKEEIISEENNTNNSGDNSIV